VHLPKELCTRKKGKAFHFLSLIIRVKLEILLCVQSEIAVCVARTHRVGEHWSSYKLYYPYVPPTLAIQLYAVTMSSVFMESDQPCIPYAHGWLPDHLSPINLLGRTVRRPFYDQPISTSQALEIMTNCNVHIRALLQMWLVAGGCMAASRPVWPLECFQIDLPMLHSDKYRFIRMHKRNCNFDGHLVQPSANI